jgi:hypothetical protein
MIIKSENELATDDKSSGYADSPIATNHIKLQSKEVPIRTPSA